MSLNFDIELDTCGLNCPLPILKAKKSLMTMQSGQVLKVMSTDPGAQRDFEAFAKQTGNDLLLQEADGDKVSIWIKRR
jgi:tRNA 2-thiouridine synthesizing protein A